LYSSKQYRFGEYPTGMEYILVLYTILVLQGANVGDHACRPSPPVIIFNLLYYSITAAYDQNDVKAGTAGPASAVASLPILSYLLILFWVRAVLRDYAFKYRAFFSNTSCSKIGLWEGLTQRNNRHPHNAFDSLY